jgi:hypothetical protein
MKIGLRVFVLVVLAACGSKENVEEGTKDGIVKTTREDGSIHTEFTYKNGKMNGLCKTYHPNGKVYREDTFVDDVLQGNSKQYYQTGILYSETFYDSGRIEGVQKLYHKDGKLKAEAFFKKDCPCLGLSEYILNGDPRPHYPEIVIEAEDKILSTGFYYVRLSLSERVKEAQFYTGNLKDGCWHEGLEAIPAPTKDTGELRFALSPGMFVMERVNIVVKIKTIAGNTLIKQKPYNISVDFPHF